MQAIFRSTNSKTQGFTVSAPMWSLVTVVILALILTGCGTSSEPAPVSPTTETAASQETQPATAPNEPAPAAEATEPAAEAMPEPTEPAVVAESTPPDSAEAPAGTESTSAEVVGPTATPEPEPAAAAEPEMPAGGGFVIGEGSEATFTVNEKLAWLDLPNDAVMRTVGIAGTIHLDGQPTVIELDLHSMTSDEERRDNYVRSRMFPDDRTATFTVSDLSDLPDPLPEGEEITREVQGELTIKGVTTPITFEVQARKDPGKLFVLGRTTFTWDDLELPPPNIPGRIEVKDEVQVEVLLSAVPGDGAGP